MGNTTLIARLVDCWNTGKLEVIDEVLSPNFIRHEADIDGTTSGSDEYKQSVSRYRNSLSDFHTEAIDPIEQGDKIAYRFRTTGRHNNARVVFEGVNIVRIEGGKVVEDWVFFDATGLQQKLARMQAA